MKKAKIIEIFNVLTAIKAEQKDSSIKFKYAVNKNLSKLDAEIKLLQEIEKENVEMVKAFNEERDNFIKEKGEHDDKGNIFISPKNVELINEFQAKLEELSDKYKDDIKKFEKAMTEYTEMLNETETEIEEFYKCSIEVCPDWLSMAQVDFLMKEGIIE
jgi:wobble nucleotide-excising tRNase